MNIACQMQIEIFHGDDLGVAAARRAALDAKCRPLRGLADDRDDAFAQVRAECLTHANRRRGLALSQWSGRDGGHIDVFSVRTFREAVEDLELDLGFIGTIQFKLIFADAKFRRDLKDGFEFASLCDLDIRGTGRSSLSLVGTNRTFFPLLDKT